MSLRDLIYSQLSAEDNNNYDLDKLSEIESEVESENESENERESESDEDSIDSNGVGNRDSDDGRERDSAPEGGADSKSIRKRAIREKIANGGLNSK